MLILVLGLASLTVFLMRLVGYRHRQERARRQELARLAEAALTDSLTGLGNHRAFYEDLRREIERRTTTGSRKSPARRSTLIWSGRRSAAPM